jgi:putative ABC transport system permease protein
MKIILIALRNLNRQKKRSILLGGAIAFGLIIVTLINGFTGSFVENVSENFSQLLAGHIFVEGVEKTESGKTLRVIRNDRPLIEPLRGLDLPVKYITKRSEMTGTIIFQGESVAQSVVGVNWTEEEFLKERIVLLEGNFDEMEKRRKGIILDQDTVERLQLHLYDKVDVKLRTISGQLNVGDFTLVGVSYDPGLFGSLSGYAGLDYVNELLTLSEGEYMQLGIFLEDLKYIEESADVYYSALEDRVSLFDRASEEAEGEQNPVQAMMEDADEEEWTGTRYRFYTLNDVLSEVDQIVDILNQAGLIILLILFAIIMVGITNTFRMIMYERIKEIGTMRSLGMQRNGIRSLFLLEALFLSLGGAVIGLFFSGIIMLILSNIFWGYDTPLYILMKNGYLTFNLQVWQVLGHLGIIAFLTLLAAFFPTNKAARMNPVDALRSI